ncbi:putative methyltransferase domain-containing protein [Neofusicoccum parvum UCRNP2]|uniref:Putative methyltransferase domain-containing protein n=1 Tax=Botryosphaeria parva (strain UCR-NP2) TaxID=1287680 RepID=R1GEF0_BOTPV|nr:putative methyltransferase domain-containing protein [Neofusicoccum parvum UCRNP2]
MPSQSPERAPASPPTNVIEVDADLDGADSTYGDDEQSFTTSLTSSVTAYKYEHGRRFHAYKEGSYKLFTKPGGYAEFQDWNIVPTSDDGTATEDNKIIQLQKLVVEATRKIGKEPIPGPQLKGWMEEAGYVDVTERIFKMPLGTWPKDKNLKHTGAASLLSYLDGLEAMTYGLLPPVLGWKIEEVQVLLAEQVADVEKGVETLMLGYS